MASDDLPLIREELARLDRRTQLILTSAGEGIYGLDREGLATFVNPAAAAMLGWSVEALLGESMHANHHHSRRDGSEYPRLQCPIYAAFKDGKVHSVDDEVFWRRDGSSFDVEYTSTPIREAGELVGAVVVFRDVTERKRGEYALRRALGEVEALKNQLQAQNVYLREELDTELDFDEIIGESMPIQAMCAAIDTVAPTVASVLVTGETGTGKELVARAIHARGPRKDKALIRVNCASIPRELFESEFFGHVRGAFTGAIRDRSGRFQLADGGTLFLDEVGEIPLEMQSKLLRVLQTGEFERVGEEHTRCVDVRIIAATNRDLRREAETGRFRQDLYYRLNVFPIEVAPLRYRKSDIGLLARHISRQLARKSNRPLPKLTQECVQRLEAYAWPGNVRELQNVVERAFITAQRGVMRFDLPDDSSSAVHTEDASAGKDEVEVATDAELRLRERQNLIAALQRTNWRIYGPGGAAELIGVKPTTLSSRLKKLGIKQSRRS